jgi:serine/threonine protein kinase
MAKSKNRKRKREKGANHQESNHHGQCSSVGERYEKLGRIGEGTYGIVYKARDKTNSKLVALKRCLPHNESSDGFPLTTLREIQSLRICKDHANIVHFQEVTVSTNGVFLVFDYCENDLAQLVDAHYQKYKKSPFSQTQVKRLLFQLLSALDFMHSRYLIHRDIKLSNLLYSSSEGALKLADFGLSRKLGPSLTPKVVSLWYRPPELLLGSEEYDAAVDLWGSGCVFGELLEGNPLMDGKNELDQLSKMIQLLGPPTVAQWPVSTLSKVVVLPMHV